MRLLVRRPEQVSESLDPLGVKAADIVVGDVLDERVLSRAVDGCTAAVHAAGIFLLDPRRAEDMQCTNGDWIQSCTFNNGGADPVWPAAAPTCRSAISIVPTTSRRSPRSKSLAGCRRRLRRW